MDEKVKNFIKENVDNIVTDKNQNKGKAVLVTREMIEDYLLKKLLPYTAIPKGKDLKYLIKQDAWVIELEE